MQEIFKDIKGYEGLYQVSNLGRIKSLPRKIKLHTGVEFYTKEKIVKGSTITKKHRYKIVSLCGSSHKTIHKLVWETFNGEVPQGLVIDHINNDRNDNRLENLQLLSHRDNVKKEINKEKTSSKYHGIYYDKIHRKWCISIAHNYINYWGGRHNNEEDAKIYAEKLNYYLCNNDIGGAVKYCEYLRDISKVERYSYNKGQDFYKNSYYLRSLKLMKPIVMIKNDVIIEEFESVKSAIIKYNYKRPNLTAALKNGTKAYGYHWRYK